MSEFQPYLVSYRHDGSEWSLEIMARSYDDARARLGKLALARIDGVVALTIPGGFGPLAPLYVWLRNLFGRRS
jgi:hypothetical protein